ncbi:unnamed protein product [Clavelina lepadiformis]|uniref:Uncharacterized protein n=1 Tax=Clavelina lepadiformis TaxID=159417 RepID=A0ABP0F152_CLALP
MSLPQIRPRALLEMVCKILRYEESCDEILSITKHDPVNGLYCPGHFDGVVCWKHTKPGTQASEPCPEYFGLNDDSLSAYRFCNDDGTWLQTNDSGIFTIWTNRDECWPETRNSTLEADISSNKANHEGAMLSTWYATFTTGYVMSLCSLFIAICLLTFFKKLHCTRNFIHMNLMISFMIRYIAMMVKDKVLDSQYSIHSDSLNQTNLDESLQAICDEFDELVAKMITCRVSLTLMSYAIVANYFWLLAEGAYLQLLLLFSVPEYKYFPVFLVLCWGAPWIPVCVWVALKMTLDDDDCWDRFDEFHIHWALDVPIIISIAINFVIFVNIVRILVSKLRAKHMERTDYKYRLAKSTLALIPLLGMHYIVFLAINNETVASDSVTLQVKVAFEMIFTSFQGCLISILYCFLNGEVQGEIIKIWSTWRRRNGVPAAGSRNCSSFYSNGIQLTSITSSHAAASATSNYDHSRRESAFSSRRSTACDQSSSSNFNASHD